jgi:nitrate reductase NapAB chaperone NapD|tara:strand:- start:872 stop:1108 length:237 start_codon:yes stop_codon:yes gene_type:complete
MPVKSYIAHAMKGKKEELMQALLSYEQCQVVPAVNQDILTLVIDTSSELEEEKLIQKIEVIPSLKLLSFVSGFNAPHN